MNTKKILLFTDDSDLAMQVRMSALTLTKLNCQVTLDEVNDVTIIPERSSSPQLDLIIIDATDRTDLACSLVSSIRENEGSARKKILVISDGDSRDKIFRAGCDSVMEKKEFCRAVNNILVL